MLKYIEPLSDLGTDKIYVAERQKYRRLREFRKRLEDEGSGGPPATPSDVRQEINSTLGRDQGEPCHPWYQWRLCPHSKRPPIQLFQYAVCNLSAQGFAN
jgi:hypothetical protein